MGKKKGKGKSQGQGAAGDQPQQTGTGPSTPTSQQPGSSGIQQQPQQPEAPKPQEQQPQSKGKQKQQKGQQQGQLQQQQAQQPQPQQTQQQVREPQGPQQQRGPQQQQGGPQQQQQGGPQQQRGPQQQQQQRGPQQQQQHGGPQQHQRGPQQQGGPQQQQQWRGPQQQQQPQGQQQQFRPRQQGPRGQQPSHGFQQQPPQGFPQQLPPGYQQQRPRGPPPPGYVQQQQYAQPPPQWGPPMQQVPQGPRPQQPMGQQPGLPPHVAQQQQQQRGPPPGMASPPPGTPPAVQQPQSPPPQQQQQQQQRPGPRQQQPPQRQQQQPQQPPQQPQQQDTASPPSPPFGGQGDCLKQLALVKPGTNGRRIRVESNHLALNVGNLLEAIHYDVAITPDTPKNLLRDVMILFGKKHYPNRHPAFDGRKNLYSPKSLPFGPNDTISDTIKVEGENRTKEFKVEIKFARKVDLSPLHDMLKTRQSPQDAIQVLDIVLRSAPALSCITAGRCFFTPPKDQIIPLGDGMEMYYGFYQSAIRGWKPLLNVDVAHKAFPTAQNLLDAVCELGSDYRYAMNRDDLRRPMRDDHAQAFEKFIKTLKVKYEITGQEGSKRIYRVNGLEQSASKAKFKLEDGRVTTVEKYFQDVKRCRLQYPHLPTIWVGAKDRENKILLPMEFCSILQGQVVNRKMNENQTSAMIKNSATSTGIRKNKIMSSLNTVKYNNDPCIREFGFSINNQFEQLDARVLEPPTLQYAANAIVKPSRGVWRSDKNKFLTGATIRKWTVACATRQPCRGMEQLADMIYRMALPTGMQVTSKAIPPFAHIGGRQSLQDFIEYFKTKQDFDLILVVIPNSGPHYSFVKQAAELNVGCLTQCIKERTVGRLNPQTVGNILLKINSKMNGTNHSFNAQSRPDIMKRPCMIMGADVTHPSPDARDIPSVAAVTASHDPKAFQYNICWRLQPPKVEIIEDLCNITIEQLKFFYKKNNCKPERIVFFRDGVSEGQFREVQRAEITALRNACKVLEDEYEPKITFLVVQKRHHTRLFPTNPRDSEDKNMNVPAGTCVDTHITNPMMQDFYLVSHASIQGVAKPTKYCTLWDENNMSNDDIEELTYHLCHMFTRCNRSVSYPAPTYYAHLAAARAKVYIENARLNMNELKRHQENYQIKECISKDKPMFFV